MTHCSKSCNLGELEKDNPGNLDEFLKNITNIYEPKFQCAKKISL